MRILLDGIFRTVLNHYPSAEDLEKIANPGKPGYRDLRNEIASKLGLEVEWSLLPESKAASWLANLAAASPKSTVLVYNRELAATEFKLVFSLTVERASLTHLHLLQRRAAHNLPPEEEFKRVFERVYEMTIPAFRAVWTGLNVWNTELVRELAVDGFAKVVADRLAKEFGYQVKFSDFTPEPNASVIEAVERVSPHKMLLIDYEHAESLLLNLKELRNDTLKGFEGDFGKVKQLDERIVQAEAELVKAQNQHLAGNEKLIGVLETIKPAVVEDLRQKFRTALLLEDATKERARYGSNV